MKTWNVAVAFIFLTIAPAMADPCNGHKVNPNEQCVGASVSNDGKDFTPLFLELEANGDLKGLRVGDGNGKIFSNAQLSQGADLMIHGHSGVVKAQAYYVKPATGATLRLVYDSDIVFWGTKRVIDLTISRTASGTWQLTYQGKPITKLVMTPESRGISNISAVAMLADTHRSVDEILAPATGPGKPSTDADTVAAKSVRPIESGVDFDEKYYERDRAAI